MPKVLGSVNPLVSDPLQHVTKERFKESRRPKNVSFYANGRPQIKGLNIRITPNKYNTFNELLKDLQRNFKLPFGVRRVYTPVNGSEICDIEDMDDGQTYLCASFERFRKAHYGQNTRPEWGHGGQPGGIVRGGGFRHAARNDKAGVRLKPLLNSQHLYESPKIRRRQHDQATGKENAPLATTWGTAPRDKFVGSIGHRGPRPGNIVPLYQATRKIRVVSDYDPTVSYDYLLDSSKVSSYDALLADISANLGEMKEDMKKLFSLEKSREIRGIRDLVSLSAEDTLVGTSKEVLNEKTLRAICNAIQVYKHAKSTPSKHDSGFSDGGVDSPGFDSRPRKMEADKHKKDQYARIKNDIDHEDLSQQEKELARLHHRKKERERREREKIINQENEKNQNERRRRNLKLRDSDRKRRSDYVDGSQSPVRSNEDLLPNAEHHERLRRKRERKRQHLQSKPTRADLIENSLELDDKYHSDAKRPLERDLNDAEIAERERRKKDDRKRSKDLNNFKDSMRHKRQADKEAEKHRIERKENTEDTRLNKDDEDQISAQRSEQLRKLRELEREREYMRKTALKAEEEAIKQKKKTAVSNINAGEIADEEERLAARAERERQKAEKANAQSAQQEAVLEAERVKKKKADNLAKIREEELAEAERRRKQKEEEDRAAAEAEERRKREKAAEEEKQRLKDLQEEQDRIAAEAAAAAAARATKQRQEEEKQRQAAEAAKAAEAAAAKAAAERRAEEEKEKARKAAEEAKKAEEARIEEEKRKAEEEKRKAEEEKRKAEEAKRKAEEEERQRKEAAKRKAEEEARQKEKNRPMGLVLPLHEDDEIARKYDLRKKVGDGNFANVFHATLKQGDPPPTAPPGTKDFAIKQIDKSKVVGKVSMLKNEIEIMKSCDHPNICKLYEAYETDKHVYLVMEHVQHGDLFDAISENVKFDEVQSALIIKNLSESLDYLHSRKIVHRDIKPENILVEKDSQGKIKRVKLADFGLAMHVKEKIHAVCGTPTYVAPEILAETGYGLEVDNWAAGVIAYILLCGFPPFRSIERNQDELFDTIQRGEFEYLSPYWDNVSDIAKDLIDQLLVVESRKRMKAKEIQKHKFIALNTNKE